MSYKMKKVDNPYCPFCRTTDQTISHLFVSCPLVASFWSEFSVWYHSRCNEKLDFSKNEIMYGVLSDGAACLTFNHLIIVGKYFLYRNAIKETRYQFADCIELGQKKNHYGKLNCD